MDWYNSGSRPGKPKSKSPRRRRISKKEEKDDPAKHASEEEEELELSVGKDKLMSVESSPRTMENNPGDDTESGKLVVDDDVVVVVDDVVVAFDEDVVINSVFTINKFL